MSRVAATILLVVAALGAAPPRPGPPPRPAPAPQPRQPGVWQQIQPSLDRSTGRITDDTSYELDRLGLMRADRFGLIPTRREFDLLQAERERALRIEQRNRELRNASERERRAEMDLREYDMFIHSGIYAASADEDSLNRAKTARDNALIDADNHRLEAVKAQPNNRAQFEADYANRAKQIRAEYERERTRIFGLDTPPTTQP